MTNNAQSLADAICKHPGLWPAVAAQVLRETAEDYANAALAGVKDPNLYMTVANLLFEQANEIEEDKQAIPKEEAIRITKKIAEDNEELMRRLA